MLADRTGNRSSSYAIPNGHTCASFALPPHYSLYPIFAPSLSPFFAHRSISFALFFPPSLFASDRKQIRDTRRSVLHAVLCHTRQQARKSNFHRETYYQPSREYDVPRRNTREWHGSHCRSHHSIESADSACGNSPIVPTGQRNARFGASLLFFYCKYRNATFHCTYIRLKYGAVLCPLPFRANGIYRESFTGRTEGTRAPRVGPTFRINHATDFPHFSVVNKLLERSFPSFL